jgi:hypothetical protein
MLSLAPLQRSDAQQVAAMHRVHALYLQLSTLRSADALSDLPGILGTLP